MGATLYGLPVSLRFFYKYQRAVREGIVFGLKLETICGQFIPIIIYHTDVYLDPGEGMSSDFISFNECRSVLFIREAMKIILNF